MNSSEYEFKIALKNKKQGEVVRILKAGLVSGGKIVEYLKEEGCADIALLFEKDTKTRFDLCLTAGDIKKAYETALEIKEMDIFQRLV